MPETYEIRADYNAERHSYEELVYQRFTTALAQLPAEIRADVYALSFLYGIFWKGDIVCTDYLELSYSTEGQYREQIANASDAEESRWNFAFWRQDILAQIPDFGGMEEDPNDKELRLRDQYFTFLGLHPTGSDGSGRPTYFGLDTEHTITQLGAKVAKRLHNEGIIQRLFGKPIPIIIHSLTYEDAGQQATRQGNPPEALKDVAVWICNEDIAE